MHISSSVTDIWLFYYFADLAAKQMPIPAHFREVFWGLTLKWSPILLRPQKAHSWPETRVLAYRCPDRSRNATWAHAEESK